MVHAARFWSAGTCHRFLLTHASHLEPSQTEPEGVPLVQLKLIQLPKAFCQASHHFFTIARALPLQA